MNGMMQMGGVATRTGLTADAIAAVSISRSGSLETSP